MGIHVVVLSLVAFLPLLTVVTCKKTTCPTLPCNPCQCKKYQVCGGILRNGNGNLHLPATEPNSCFRCDWILSVQPGRKIRLSFSQFELGNGDWIKVYDGSKKGDKVIVKYDGGIVKSGGGSSPIDLVTSGNKMMVQFQSDKCGEASRMTASFQAIECGGLIELDKTKKRQRKVVVKSPGFPRLYPSSANCLWTVVGKETLLSARVTVHSGETERNEDFLKIYESLSGSPAVHTYTGRLESADKFNVNSEPGLAVQFVSDKNVAYKGFKITIQVLKAVSICPRPKKLINGRVVIVDHKRGAHYSCCPGYKIVGTDTSMTCENGRWSSNSFPRCTRVTSCQTPYPPDESYIEGGENPTSVGSVVRFRCNEGFEIAGVTAEFVSATCDCSGEWKYSPTVQVPRCDAKRCGNPPPAPQPDGALTSNDFSPYGRGAIVNYTCPVGHGLDGIPYRICNRLGQWEPNTGTHRCRKNMNVCLDPGTPGNGTRRVVSFGDGHLASFGCFQGYKAEGSHLRTCHASNPNDTYWSGVPITCIDLFKAPDRLAAQWRENFIDRSIQCVDVNEGDQSISGQRSEEEPSGQPQLNYSNSVPTSLLTATPRTVPVNTTLNPEIHRNGSDNSPVNLSAQKHEGLCGRGRAVTVGGGCLDLLYAIDCSKSINLTSFKNSLEFVGSSVALFDIDREQARVALFTYDDKVYTQFKLGQINTTEGTVKAIRNSYYCKGSTATRPVLERIEKELQLRSNSSCRRAVFILTDGNNNWGGDPMEVADRIKDMPNVEIYTIAFGTSDLNWGILSSLASSSEFFIKVRHPGDLKKAIEDAHDLKIDYSKQCGTTNTPDCRARVVNGCRSKTGAWPWMVAIYDNKNRGYNFRCGGTLIDDCWVLTAAHCFPKDARIVAEDLLAVIGDTERFFQEFTEVSHEVDEIFIHNEFNSSTFDKDIALLKLNCSVKYKSQVRKACLPHAGDEFYYKSGTRSIVAGWGHTKAANPGFLDVQMSSTLNHVELQVQTLQYCKANSTSIYKNSVTENMVCAGSGNTKGVVQDACKGDSGGPLFCKRTGAGDQTYVVIGVVSFGDGCAQAHRYGYFTHVMKMMPWIKAQMGSTNCRYEHKDCPVPAKNIF